MKESEIEKYLRLEVEKRGGFVRKYTSPGRRGVPDRIVFLNGVRFAELKTELGHLSRLQKREFKRMYNQGVSVFVLNSKEQINQFLDARDPL